MMTRRRGLALIAACAAALAWAAGVLPAQTQSGARPQYTPDGKMLKLPEGFENWVFVGSNLGLAYKSEMTVADTREANRAADKQLFHNVYINPESYAHFAATREFPDPTILVMEVFVAADRDAKGVLGTGVFNGERLGIEVAVKDTRRPAGHLAPPAQSNWAYYIFMNPFEPKPVLHTTVAADRGGSCQTCHREHAGPDNVWVQFYPTLRKFLK